VSCTTLLFWLLRIQGRITRRILRRDDVSELRLNSISDLTKKFLIILVVVHEIGNGLVSPKGGC